MFPCFHQIGVSFGGNHWECLLWSVLSCIDLFCFVRTYFIAIVLTAQMLKGNVSKVSEVNVSMFRSDTFVPVRSNPIKEGIHFSRFSGFLRSVPRFPSNLAFFRVPIIRKRSLSLSLKRERSLRAPEESLRAPYVMKDVTDADRFSASLRGGKMLGYFCPGL